MALMHRYEGAARPRKRGAAVSARSVLRAVVTAWLGLLGAGVWQTPAHALTSYTNNYVTLNITNYDPSTGNYISAFVSDDKLFASQYYAPGGDQNGTSQSPALNTNADDLYWYIESDQQSLGAVIPFNLDQTAVAAGFYFPAGSGQTYAETGDIQSAAYQGGTGYNMILNFDYATKVLSANLVSLSTAQPAPVPEPGTAGLFLAGLAALGLRRSARATLPGKG